VLLTGGLSNIPGGTTGLASGSGAAPSGYYYALLGQLYTGTLVNSTYATLLTDGWSYSGDTGVNGLSAGRIAGGANFQTTAGFAVGVNNQFIIAGWSSNLGTTWAAVSAQLASGVWTPSGVAPGFFGVSSVGTGLGSASPPEAILNVAGAITTGFTLYAVPVPEPATFALAGLGGLALLAFRRRK
jgi:hypothetical protein